MRGFTVQGTRVLVFGLGVHGGGVAVARWLARHGARVIVTDMKQRTELRESLAKLKGLPIRYVLGKHPKTLLNAIDLIVRNPAVRQNHPLLAAARTRGLRIENEASLFLRLSPTQRLVAVTGSKGKSTTTALVHAMLKSRYRNAVAAGNIRDTVLFDVLDALRSATPLALEFSSWQLEEVGRERLRIPLAVVTNVLPEHLNTYRSFAAYAKAKAGIFRGQAHHDAVVLNYDNVETRRMARQAPGRVYWFSVSARPPRGTYLKGGTAYWRDNGRKVVPLFKTREVELLGRHNLANAMAASAAAYLMGVPAQGIRRAVRSFKGLHDRLEFVRAYRNVRYMNDTTATAPAATEAALEAMAGKHVVLIAGGMDKSLPYRSLARAIRRTVDSVVLLPGTATVKLQRELKGFRRVFLARSMREAVRLASALARPGATVLLSPGAASFGLFKHEFDRGREFVRSVRAL